MSQHEDGTENLECSEIVYRALKKSWVDGDSIDAQAFMRQPIPTETYVSLSRKKYATARECRQKLSKMPKTASLHVGRVRDLPLGLDVGPAPDRDDNGQIVDPGHCALLNLPDPEADPFNAEAVASKLTRLARIVSAEQEEAEHSFRRG